MSTVFHFLPGRNRVASKIQFGFRTSFGRLRFENVRRKSLMAYWPDRLTPAIIGDSKRDPGDGSNRRNKQPCVGQAILALKPSQARQKRAGWEAIPSRLGGFISYV